MAFLTYLPVRNDRVELVGGRAILQTAHSRHTAKGRRKARIDAKFQWDDNSGNNDKKKHNTLISRRQAMQLLNGVLGTMTVGLLFKMREQYRLISLQTILASIGLGRLPARAAVPAAMAATNQEDRERFQDALKYVAKVDKQAFVECPDFAKGSDWINSRPLSLNNELKGKVVLLDFFTYCCINCQHVLPKLRALETKYGEDGSGGVVVVGVHSAKFSAERETKNIAAAVERYDVKHPVINDEKMELWNAIGVSSWPTLVLLGPKGNLLAVWSGERQEQDVDMIIAAALEYYTDDVDHRPLPAAPKRDSALRNLADSPFRYPGKLAFSEDGKSLFVSDTGNNRIVQSDSITSKVVKIFGNGESKLADSSDPATASFHAPQGIVEHNGVLYVADNESHAVRAIDIASGKVQTIGGNGEQGFDYSAGRVGKSQQLSSPWDVEVVNDTLYVAMAGTHQIWSLALPPKGTFGPYLNPWTVFSGSGRELEKNALLGRQAGWAQPSHLSAAEDGLMFVADSESSSVRAIDTTAGSHPTKTLAGGDGLLAENLFAFGDKEGRGARARFQHPLAVCFDDKRKVLYVADSYNHRIKIIEESGEAKNFCGKGTPGFRDGAAKEAMFWEPAGLALSPDGSHLYVADTNNFAIRAIDLNTKNTSTITIAVAPPGASTQADDKPLIVNRRRAVKIPCGPVNRTGQVSFVINLPEKSHFTPGTSSRFQLNLIGTSPEAGQSSTQMTKLSSGAMALKGQAGRFDIDLSSFSRKLKSVGSLEVESVTYYCTEEDDVCRVESDVFNVQLDAVSTGSDPIVHTIVPRIIQQPSFKKTA